MEQGPQKTILIVDDDARVLALISEVLSDRGYNILKACNGEEGLQQSRDFKGEIQLLLSDFQMAQMSGADLANAMTIDRPDLKVLLISSFPKGLLVLNHGWHFLNKPFIPSQLRALVTELISPDHKSKFSKSPSTEFQRSSFT